MKQPSDAAISAVMRSLALRCAQSMTPEQRQARARKAGLASAAARKTVKLSDANFAQHAASQQLPPNTPLVGILDSN